MINKFLLFGGIALAGGGIATTISLTSAKKQANRTENILQVDETGTKDKRDTKSQEKEKITEPQQQSDENFDKLSRVTQAFGKPPR